MAFSSATTKYSNMDDHALAGLGPHGIPQKIPTGHLAHFNGMAIQAPNMTIAWDTRPQQPMSGQGKPMCKLPLQIREDDPEHLAFMHTLMKLDERAKQYVLSNKDKFAPKNKKKFDIDDVWTNSVKKNNEKYPPVFLSKVDFEGDELNYNIKPAIYNPDGSNYEDILGRTNEALLKGNELIAVVRPEYIWAIGGRFGITWKLVRAVLTKEGAHLENSFDFDLN